MIAADLFAAASDPSMSLPAKLERMLRIGCEGLGFELGIVSRIEGSRYEVVAVHSPADLEIAPGATFELGETYCREVLEATAPIGFDSAADPDWAGHPAHEKFGLEAYLGTRIRVLGRVYGTLNFSSREARTSPVDGQTRRVIAQLAHWIGTELEREELAAGIRRSEEIMRGVLSTSLDGIMVFESVRSDGGEIVDFRWLHVNPAGAAMVRREVKELCGRRLLDVLPGVKTDGLFDSYRGVVESGERFDTEHCYSHDFLDAWFSISARKLGDGFVVSFSDITALRRAQRDAERATDELRLILDNVPAMVWYKDAESRVLRVNASVAEAMGLPRPEIEGRSTWDLHPREAEAYCRADREAMERRVPVRGIVEKVMMGPADARWMSTDKIPILDSSGEAEGLIVVSTDITRLKATEETLRHALEHDALTGLANRDAFVRGLQECLRSRASSGFAVLMLDFDRFKAVNDSMGHQAGDELLCSIAGRLRRALKPSDVAARLGGDEFALLVRDVATQEMADQLSERVRRECEAAHAIQGQEVRSTASIGLVHSSLGLDSADSLIAAADRALYAAKAAGRNVVRRVTRGDIDAETARVRTARELKALLEGPGLEANFQPVVSLAGGEVRGVEVFCRWPGGLVPTMDLFAAAEESDLILDIAVFALRQGLEVIADPEVPGEFVAVKLGLRELLHPAVRAFVVEELERLGVDPGSLVIEIDERTFSDTRADVAAAIEAYRGLGVRVAIEKFGMGSTSLGQLQLMPVDIIKLDRRLLNSEDSILEMGRITNALVEFARQLGIEVIGEGVEHAHQVAVLHALEINLWQGYLASPPLVKSELKRRFGVRRAA
ncbi:MAG: EAL domain-containing protein [Phycisphaerales bacterium JB054]